MSFAEKYLLLLVLNFFIYCLNGCSNFDHLIHSLPYLSSPETQCITGQDCSSVQCSGKFQNNMFSVSLTVICDKEPAIRINANIPTVGITSWDATFIDQLEKAIPGYFFPMPLNHTIARQGYLNVGLQKLPSSNALILSMTIKGCEHGPDNSTGINSCVQKQIIHNEQLFCGKQKYKQEPKHCSLSQPFECGRNETCLQQPDQSNQGQCVCLEGFEYNSNGLCSAVVEKTLAPTASSFLNNGTTVTPVLAKDTEKLAVNIVVPVLVIILVAALLYAAFKHGLINQILAHCPCTRRSLHYSINEEDDDLPLP